MTRPSFRFLLALCLSFSICPAQDAGAEAGADAGADAVSVLAGEIRRAEAERDRTRKQLLELENESQEAIETLRQREAELNEQLGATGRRMRELESSAEMSRTAMERARAELRESEGAVEELRSQQLEARRRYAELLNRMRQNAGAGGLAEQRDKLREELAEKGRRLEELQSSREAAVGEVEELKGLNDHLRNELNTAKRAESLSNAKLTALESRLENLRRELARQYEERSALEQDKQRLEHEVRDLRSKLADAVENRVPKAEVEALREQLTRTEERNQSLQKELTAQEHVPDVRPELAAAARERDLLAAKEKMLVGKLERTGEELKTESIRRKAYERQNKLLSDELKSEMARRKELETRTESLAEELERARETGVPPEELAAVEDVLADMRAENLELKTVMENQRSTVDFLNRELNEEQSGRRQEVRDLQGALRDQLAAYNQARRKIEQLDAKSATLDAVRAQRAELEMKREKSRTDMKLLAEHIYDLRRRLKEGSEAKLQARAAGERNMELRSEMEKTARLNRALLEENARRDGRLVRMRMELEARDRELRRLKRELEASRRILAPVPETMPEPDGGP